MLKDPIKIWYDDLSSVIGEPKDFKDIKQQFKPILEKNKDPSQINEAESAELGKTFFVPSGGDAVTIAPPMENNSMVEEEISQPSVAKVGGNGAVSNPE